ncbi:MAG TPA: NAD(P)-dependent oxidoreductase [Gemmatimonadales bacterium]|nr:NAD(P)-dependent oxidoreductase [Gemmatimonadales bacterium]
MKALVTGATGFLGSHLVDALVARGDDVTALIRSPGKAQGLARQGVRLVRGDLHATEALAEAVADQDVIYHVAGAVAARNEAEYLHANRDGTANLLRAAEGAAQRGGRAPRFVLVSSMAAGGPARPGRPRTADEPSAPVTMYGRSKLAGEEVVRRSPLPWAILRPPTIYGPRDRDNLIKIFKIARTGVVPVFGSGSQEISAVYAPDLAEALVAAGSSDAVLGGTYYVNHPEVLTSAGLVQAVARLMGRSRARLVPIPEWAGRLALHVTGTAAAAARRATILNADKANEFFEAAWTGDPTPFMRATGWHAAHDLAAGLAETYAWYRSARWL